MNTFDRFERDVPKLLDELYLGTMPAYRDELLGRTAATRQRPGWTFIERWLPVSAITGRTTVTPRAIPWRLIAAAALLILALTAAALYVGRQPRLPAPFGPAGNGLMAYAAHGEIFVGDPRTGESTLVVEGLDRDVEPLFSRDGSKIAFRRVVSITDETVDFFVVNADGSGLTKISTEPIRLHFWDWAADNRSLIAVREKADRATQLVLLDATRAAKPRVLVDGADGDVAVRPPDGDQILFRHADSSSVALYLINADGSDRRLVVGPIEPVSGVDLDRVLQGVTWSPDGSMFAFIGNPAGTGDYRVFVANADGGGVRQLTIEPGEPGGVELYLPDDAGPSPTWHEGRPVWSPDGSRIAFGRWFSATPSIGESWSAMATGVARIDSGIVVEVGPEPPGGGGFTIEWSPDGNRIFAIPDYYDRDMNAFVIDPVTNTVETVPWTVDETWPSWQRISP